MTTKFIIVGDRPSTRNLDVAVPFIGTPSHTRLMRMLEYAGISEYLLCNAYDINGQLQPLPYAHSYVALGWKAHNALRQQHKFSYLIPHPSPRSRVWNSPDAEIKFANELRRIYNVICL